VSLGAYSVLIESEPKLWIVVLTRFLHTNRYPPRYPSAGQAFARKRSNTLVAIALVFSSRSARLFGVTAIIAPDGSGAVHDRVLRPKIVIHGADEDDKAAA
jgi:hypothetical protein